MCSTLSKTQTCLLHNKYFMLFMFFHNMSLKLYVYFPDLRMVVYVNKNNPHLSKESFATTTNIYATVQRSTTNMAAVLRLGCTLSIENIE